VYVSIGKHVVLDTVLSAAALARAKIRLNTRIFAKRMIFLCVITVLFGKSNSIRLIMEARVNGLVKESRTPKEEVD
jgi:hypothetical protein